MNQWRSSRLLLILAAMFIVVLAAGYGAYRLWSPPPPAPNAVSKAIVFVSGMEPLSRSADPQARERYQRIVGRSEAWWARISTDYPDLDLKCREVPEDRNGFLKWVEFVERRGCGDLGTPQVLSMWFSGSARFDRFEAKRWIVSNRPLLDELRAIGELPDQSLKGIALDRWKRDSGRFALRCAEGLMLEARIAAVDGDEATAVRCMRAVQGLAAHFEGIEIPDDQQWMIANCIGLRMRTRILNEMVPCLSDARLCHPELWEPLLQPPVCTPKEYARLLRGNWQMTLREFLLPTLGNLRDQGLAADADGLVAEYSKRMRSQILACERADSLSGLPSWGGVTVPPASLSPECRDLFLMAMEDRGAGSRGWLCMQVEGTMDAAAFDIMCGGPVPKEPVSGKPFVWDEGRRELALPNEPCLARLKVQPRNVPQLVLSK